MKKFFQEFKEFISKGNVIDMAVAVVIGGAFGKIVTALVNDIIMPLVGLLVGGSNIADLKWVIREATETQEATVFAYGDFIQTIVDFLIVAFCIFLMLKVVLAFQNRAKELAEKLQKKEIEEAVEEAATEPVETQEDILKDIRALLKAQAEK